MAKQIRRLIKMMVEDGVINSLPHGFFITPDERDYIDKHKEKQQFNN